MEEACSPIAKHKDPNGFVNRVFNVSLDVENVTGAVQIQDPGQGDAPASGPSQEDGERVATGRKPRTAGIWRILTRRKTTIGSERRPHSMILPGENSPQLSFVDKVRSFKKLKPPSIFKERSFKLYGVKCGSTLKDDPDIQSPSREYPGQTHSRRRPFRSKGKRHSYAGRTKEFDCSFEDVDLTRPSENNQQLPHDMSSSQNGSKGAPNSKVKAHPNFSNSNNSSAHDEHPWRDCPKTPQGGRRLRGADVWGYLRKISLMGKGSSGMSGKSFDSELHTLDKTIDSDCASADFECIRDHSPPPAAPAADSKGGHFRGLFRFFSSVAETARKWRNSAQSFSPPEGERSQLGSPCSQRSGLFAHNVPLHPGNEDKGATAMSLNSNSGRGSPADLGGVPVAATSPTWRERRPVSVYTPQLSLQCPVLEEGVVFSGQDGPSSPLWKRRAGPCEPGEPVMRRPVTRRRPHSVIDGHVPMETEPMHPLTPMSRPPGLSPRHPPMRATLQRCQSLPLSQSTPSGLERAGWTSSSPRPGAALKLQSDATWHGGHTGTIRRRLLRPGSEQLHINMCSLVT
ncbi:hypothetical protein COCON_G00045660 [Conger conger]|uniref:Uncharacterized protein n=1 Tax=Conger conger TaxID=82655 RepID=A0A9Q1DUF9_CONCO|nr:hypothetical protein COCON_G00045660 [Conger conger]